MDQTNQQNSNQQPISRLVLENNVPCFINEGGNLILVLPNGDKINPLFTDKIYWLKRVAYALGISPSKVEKLIEKQRSGQPNSRRPVKAVGMDVEKKEQSLATQAGVETIEENVVGEEKETNIYGESNSSEK